MSKVDAMNPYTPVMANDRGAELTEIVMRWYRGNRGVLNSSQQSAVVTAITNILSGSAKV